MTSPSRRKLRTTRWSTLRATCDRLRSRWSDVCAAGAVALILATGTSAADPIGDLKQRSADQRWTQLRGEFVSTPPGTAPATVSSLPSETPARSGPALPIGKAPSLPQPVQPYAPGQWNAAAVAGSSTAPFVPPAPLESAPSSSDFTFTSGDGQQSGAKPATQIAPHNLVLEGFLAPGASSESPTALQPEPPVTPAPFPIPSGPAPEQYAPVEAAPLQTAPSNMPTTKYAPRPLNEILPYHDYSPEGLAICPSPEARCPIDVFPPIVNAERSFAPVEFYWQPSNLFYQPLYFEDPALERYGHTYGHDVQPLASLGRFGVQLVGLPYFMAIKPPHTCESPLGFFRPGECAPKQCERLPLNCEAAVIAAGVYTAIGFIFPF